LNRLQPLDGLEGPFLTLELLPPGSAFSMGPALPGTAPPQEAAPSQ